MLEANPRVDRFVDRTSKNGALARKGKGSMEDFLHRVERLAHARTSTIDMKMKQYDEWAAQYDDDVCRLEYRAPSESVELLYCATKCLGFTFDGSTRVIDFAAGTGMVASALHQKHFPGEIDALDGSSKMLEIARKRGVYSRIYQCLLKPNVALPLSLSHYDVAFICGALSDSQVETSCLRDMLQHLKVGGIFVFSTRSNLSNLKYKEDLESVIDSLCKSGVWSKVLVRDVEQFEKATSSSELTVAPDNAEGESFPFISGTVYCYRKLK